MKIKNRHDFNLGVGLAAFCLFCLFIMIPYQVGPMTEAESLLPVLIVLFILALSILMILSAIRFEAQKKDAPPHTRHFKPITMATVIVIMIAYASLLDFTGFLLTSLLAMIVLFLVFGVRQYLRIAVITLLTLSILYVSFEKFLGAPLPVGTLIENLLE